MNATSSINTMASMSPIPIAILIFIAIGLALFLLFKYFRRFIYDSLTLIAFSAIAFPSWKMADATTKGNYTPILVLGAIIVGIIISIIIGIGIEKSRFGRKIEKSILGK